MRTILALPFILSAVACGSSLTTNVDSNTQLGRVVIYRNGVAYFERYADLQDDTLRVAVPGDKVDDFLKSLTVVDTQTGKPAPISYPSAPSGGTIDMKIQLVGKGPHRMRLSYVTEAPAWKPSYRAIVGADGKVDVQAWAIVDNTSAEDWNDVKLGVGSSSALAFRFDLRSLRFVQRETLRTDSLFAQAPPMGGASVDQRNGMQAQNGPRVLSELTDDLIAPAETSEMKFSSDSAPTAQVGTRQGSSKRAESAKSSPAPARAPSSPMSGVSGGGAATNANAQNNIDQLAISANRTQNTIVIEGYATAKDADKSSASLDRANKIRDQLIQRGVDPGRVFAIGKGQDQARSQGGVRVVEQAPSAPPPKEAIAKGASVADGPGDPVGVSHFESGIPMSVPKGTSAMVSIMSGKTDGEVVYLYDAETTRGNAQFPFKALRFKNPTDSALESGPVSVFGQGRFIGEGLTEPIPSRATAFVPFALDRQIVVERKDKERDEVLRIITAARGVFQTEVKHTRRLTFAVLNRQNEKATLFMRHTIPQGFTLGDAPPHAEKLNGATLFRVDLGPGERKEVTIEENSPLFKTTDVRTPTGLEEIRAYVSAGAVKDESIKNKLTEIVRLNGELVKYQEEITSKREQMTEYRSRMDELHNQIFTLKAVKTAGSLMQSLERKLQEISDKMSKATMDVVGLEEKKMVARVKLQDAISDLSLEKKDEKPSLESKK